MKHRLKIWLRSLYARFLYHTGLHAVMDRWMPRRLTILAGHCVAPSDGQDFLPADMKIDVEKLARILRWFSKRYELCTVGSGVQRLQTAGRRSLVALSMDDGYRDNRTVLLPLLEKLRAPATVFLETRPLEERRVNWTHKFFWILARTAPREFVDRYRRYSRERQKLVSLLESLVRKQGNFTYRFKRFLKYEADPVDRDRTLDRIFADLGGDEEGLCRALYMSWDDARALRDSGCELGSHTRTHAILSRVADGDLDPEIRGSSDVMLAELGSRPRTFAYPFGRNWDFLDATTRAVAGAGFQVAVTTHPGTNGAGVDPLQLRRVMIDGDAELHLLAAEACGGFDLLRRIGLKLPE